MAEPFDDNVIQFLRLQNTFGQPGISESQPIPQPPQSSVPTQVPTQTSLGLPQNQTPVQTPMFQAESKLSPISGPEPYQNRTIAQDQLLSMINEVPERNKPGTGRKIAAILSSIVGGPDLADRILYQPYYRELQDYNAKFDPVHKAATLENQGNSQNRLIWQERNRNLIAVARENRLREMDEFKRTHPDWELKETAGGKWVWFNPKNPLDTPIDSGATTGDLSDADLVDRRGMWGVLAASASKAEDANQIKVQQYLRAMQLANSDPDLADIISLGDPTNGSFQMENPNNALLKWITKNVSGKVGALFDRSSAERKYQDALRYIYAGTPMPGMLPPPAAPTQNPQFPGNAQTQGMNFPGPIQTPAQTPTQVQPGPIQNQNQPPVQAPTQTVPVAPVPPLQGNNLPPVPPGPTPKPAYTSPPITKGPVPPLAQRVIGQIHTFENGNVGKWNGVSWDRLKN